MCYVKKTGPGSDDCPLLIPCMPLCQNPPPDEAPAGDDAKTDEPEPTKD